MVACEFSGRVRDAFAALGHDAWSVDLLPSETHGQHIQADVRWVLSDEWDLLIAFPPCQYLARSGARWWKQRQQEQADALKFVEMLMAAPIKQIALENPIGKINSAIRKPDQIIQPWQHGHGETKATALWLKNLPHLSPSEVVAGREDRIYRVSARDPERWKTRSRTYTGVAKAMAEQWGGKVIAPPNGTDHTPEPMGTPALSVAGAPVS